MQLTSENRARWLYAAAAGGLLVLAAAPVLADVGFTVSGVLGRAAAPSSVPAAEPLETGSFQIVLNASSALRAEPAALDAFRRAAAQWESRLADPVRITIEADLNVLPFNIIGSTNAVILQGTYDEIINPLISDAVKAGDRNAVVAALPSATQFAAQMPALRTLTGNLLATKANLKAMGFDTLDQEFGTPDGAISFNSFFPFDYDNRDGVEPGKIDFESAAAHEIGHVLGFISIVDSINAGELNVSPFTLDLFRFRTESFNDPGNLLEFRTFKRDLFPAARDHFDDLERELPFSTGLNGEGLLGGDGFQASHWKADDITGRFIGLMDPSLDFGVLESVTDNDLRALDLIGYDVLVPEPAGLLALAGLSLLLQRRRRLAECEG